MTVVFAVLVVTGNGQGAAVLGPRPDGAREARCWKKMLLNTFTTWLSGRCAWSSSGGGRRLVVELGEGAVALGVVVHRVEHDLAAQRLDRHGRDRP